jgi:hypothetical protein
MVEHPVQLGPIPACETAAVRTMVVYQRAADRVCYRYGRNGGEWQDIAETVPFATTPSHLGVAAGRS